MHIYDDISLSAENEKCFSKKLERKSKHTFYVQYVFSENHTVFEIMCENM